MQICTNPGTIAMYKPSQNILAESNPSPMLIDAVYQELLQELNWDVSDSVAGVRIIMSMGWQTTVHEPNPAMPTHLCIVYSSS